MSQKDAWELFYKSNYGPWRGISKLDNVPFIEGFHILEIGCGNGKTAEALSNLRMIVTGIDFSQSAINACIKRSIKNTDFICADVLALPFSDNSFDGATAFHIFEHLSFDELTTAIREIKRVLKKGAHILVKVFSKGDMRSMKGFAISDSTVIRGNGIKYHYFSEDELCHLFKDWMCKSIVSVDEKTRFGSSRKKIYADFVL
ncbi:MAG: class I SAM-dependent methyltransferase [archaeon]|nr:class I SAM-dependent methyltransferase [archaeon]